MFSFERKSRLFIKINVKLKIMLIWIEQLEGIPPLQVVATKDPRLVERNLPLYPPLPPTVDSRKIEEIRRTIMICNISNEVSNSDLPSKRTGYKALFKVLFHEFVICF